MSRPNIARQIREARDALAEVIQDHLSEIAEDLVTQVFRKAKNLPSSRLMQATDDVDPKGLRSYEEALKATLAVIATDALEQVRKEVPKKKNVELAEGLIDATLLAEFDQLPLGIRRRITKHAALLVATHAADIEKVLKFQYASSIDSTDSLLLVQADLKEALEDFIAGSAVQTGASNVASLFVNEARNHFLFNDEVADEIEAYQFVNGDPVSPVCQDLNGKIFAKDDPEADRYKPPLHHNCKSYLVPILIGNLKGRPIERLKPSSSDLEKHITLSEEHTCSACE